MSAYFYLVLSCTGAGLTMNRSPFQGVLPKCANGSIVSEVNFKIEQVR
jgi:hypothetical protein